MCLGVPGQIQAISDATRHLAIVDIEIGRAHV